ncbi:MAG: site-specific integrase [Flavobacteriales bacterium]|nr:site-specific integrase [Flavobacteriales bacterium]
MKNTFSILFYIRTSKKKTDGTTPIYVRVTINGKRSDFSAKRSIDASKWNKSKARAKGTNENVRRLNTYLDTLKQKLYDSHQHLLNKGKVVSAKAITNHYLGKSEEKKTILEVFKLHNDNITALIGKGYAKSTITKYNTTYSHLKSFIKHKYKSDDLHLIQMSLSTITDFDHYLKTVKGVGVNCTNKYLTHLNKVINLAVDSDWLDKNPCLNHKMKNETVTKDYLSELEIQLLIDKDITNNRLSQVRDVFIFCCLTGLSFIDVKKLTPVDVKKGIDRKQWIYTSRQKTGTKTNIPLFPHALTLIEIYKNHPEAVNRGTLLPVLSNQKMNSYLKEVAVICNINKHLTMHLARHTFATYLLTKNVPIESVSKLLGHKSLKTTQIYAKVIDSKVADDIGSIIDDAPTLSLRKVS